MFVVIGIKVSLGIENTNGEFTQSLHHDGMCRGVLKLVYGDINMLFEKQWGIQVQSIEDLIIYCRIFTGEQLTNLWDGCSGTYHKNLASIIIGDSNTNFTVSLQICADDYQTCSKVFEDTQSLSTESASSDRLVKFLCTHVV